MLIIGCLAVPPAVAVHIVHPPLNIQLLTFTMFGIIDCKSNDVCWSVPSLLQSQSITSVPVLTLTFVPTSAQLSAPEKSSKNEDKLFITPILAESLSTQLSTLKSSFVIGSFGTAYSLKSSS